jgi:aminopeptidase N
LHYYADLFQIDYPMAKLDLVAVPDLFYPAMEDWALILFKVLFFSIKKKKSNFYFLFFIGRRNVNK